MCVVVFRIEFKELNDIEISEGRIITYIIQRVHVLCQESFSKICQMPNYFLLQVQCKHNVAQSLMYKISHWALEALSQVTYQYHNLHYLKFVGIIYVSK